MYHFPFLHLYTIACLLSCVLIKSDKCLTKTQINFLYTYHREPRMLDVNHFTDPYFIILFSVILTLCDGCVSDTIFVGVLVLSPYLKLLSAAS